MDFTDTGIYRSDSAASDQDHDLRQCNNHYSLDSDFLRLRSQIFEGSYRRTDLIRVNLELSHERDALRRRNRELEAGILEAEMIRKEMKRDMEVSKERVGESDGETKEKSKLLSDISDSVRSMEDRLSKSIRCLNEEEEERGGKLEREEYNFMSILELVKEVETKLKTFMESMEKKKLALSRSVELLEEENRDISILLRAALSEKQTAEKQLKEMNEQKGSALLQIAGRGLQRIGFGFGFGDSVEESSEAGNLAKDKEREEENGVVIAIENTMKKLRQEVSQLKISLEESRLEEERLKKFTEEQAQKIAENTVYIDNLQNQEMFLAQNVEELVKVIREAESEVSRWREACELEVEAGQREVEVRDQLIAVLKTEVEKLRSALTISEGKLKLKEELAKAAMVAEEAAEKSLRLSERRIAQLLSRIENLYRQLEEAESTERRRGKFRYVWCWPMWRLPTAASAAATASGGSSYTSNRELLRYDA
ncbi:unnamed protein product [Arabidopsis lyrata]|uniref:ATP binding protein n=1 Tax=Arabidopsis lyrata subsp. lyrata TaxID=81972 RepID=D7LS35_ARALL|nr:uncharacterized protein At3g49055 [Arabidopsis lyrata subsp. lyrata]EFH53901.1 hypothetical protein ARALYDRAFT_347996 [Arabidopsis lyrata subsp. lyrata]CAH8267948.1 unnamed protein product [Arabidopsis lyrata]|eukprot:XP_002877642.1 uncharacterized protein At3g49055 [Arabidopsis lyrata subsp. lyrata]